jgi:hypothetical protein
MIGAWGDVAPALREEPAPNFILLRVERCSHQPDSYPALGLVRVRFLMRSGAWSYVAVPADAVVRGPHGEEPASL